MTNYREKVAPWEEYDDGEWHEVRRGPEGEAREESLRQYRRHWESMRAWAGSNGYRGQISRQENGRILRVRFLRPGPTDDVQFLRPMSRAELGRSLMSALTLLDRALNLRRHGEGDETWERFDREAEAYLRKVRRLPHD